MTCQLVKFSNGNHGIMCTNIEESMLRRLADDQEQEAREWEAEQRQLQDELAGEAARRGCSEDELLALWQGKATYLPDYDDHSSDDPRCEQNICNELGMHVFNPHIDVPYWIGSTEEVTEVPV